MNFLRFLFNKVRDKLRKRKESRYIYTPRKFPILGSQIEKWSNRD